MHLGPVNEDECVFAGVGVGLYQLICVLRQGCELVRDNLNPLSRFHYNLQVQSNANLECMSQKDSKYLANSVFYLLVVNNKYPTKLKSFI